MTFRVYKKGTATSSTSGSVLIDNLRKEYDGFFNSMYLKITSGSNNGLERIVSTWTLSTTTFVFTNPFPNSIQTGTTYEVGVYFTHDPGTIIDDNPPDMQNIRSPGNLPIILSYGRKPRVLTLEGIIYYIMGKQYSELLYVIPLRNLSGHAVWLEGTYPAERFNGEYIFQVKFKETPRKLKTFEFTATFYKGSAYVVL